MKKKKTSVLGSKNVFGCKQSPSLKTLRMCAFFKLSKAGKIKKITQMPGLI